MNHKLATIISRIFEPFVVLTVLFIIKFYSTSLFLPALFLMIVLPFVLFLIAWKTKFVSNWDVTDRSQRPKLLWTLIGIEAVASILLKTNEIIPVILALVGFAIITQFWKISGHAMAAALVSGFIVSLFGYQWWPVLLIVPIVSWARVIRKDHTIPQVVAGALYSFIFVYFFIS